MRSFDRSMPEELNRVLADHASDLLLCSSEVAVDNLRREAVAGAVELVGDVMVDVAVAVQPRARARTDLVSARGVDAGRVRAGHGAPGGQRRRSRSGCGQLVDCCWRCRMPVVLPLHPRTRGAAARCRAATSRSSAATA